MTYTTNILAMPLVLIVWVLDMYLLLLSARLVLSRLSNERAKKLCSCLMQFTDPLMQTVKQWLGQRTGKQTKQWVPWVLVAAASLMIRHLLVLLIASLG